MAANKDKKEMLGANTAKSLYLLYAGQILNLLITIGTFVVLTRILGPSTYGLYVFAFSFSALIGASGNFGIATYLGKYLSKYCYEKDGKSLGKALSSGYSVLVVVALVLTLFAVGISNFAANMIFQSVGISSLSLVLTSLTIFFLMIQNSTVTGLVGASKPKQAALTTIIIDIVQLISIIVLLSLGYGLNGAIIGMLIGYVIGTALSVFLIVRAVDSFKGFKLAIPTWQEFKDTFFFAAPLGANNILNTFTQNFSVLFLGFYVTTAVLGNLGVALRGLSLTAILYSTMTIVLIPTFSKVGERKKKDNNKTYNHIMIYSLIFTLPVIVFIGVMARPEIFLLFTSKYSLAPLYLTLISLGTAISMIAYFLGSLITARGVTTKFLIYNLYATLIEFVFVIILTHFYTVVGSIVAVFIIGNIAGNIFLIKLAKKELNANLDYKRMWLLVLLNLLLAIPIAAALLISSNILSLVAGLIITALVYPPMLALSGLVKKEDLKLMSEAASGLKFVNKVVDTFCRYSSLFMGGSGA